MKHLSFLKEVAQRWKTPLGSFWKKIRNFAITLGGTATALIGADALFHLQDYGVAPEIFTVCGYIIVFCVAIGLSSQITTKHPEDFDDDKNKFVQGID